MSTVPQKRGADVLEEGGPEYSYLSRLITDEPRNTRMISWDALLISVQEEGQYNPDNIDSFQIVNTAYQSYNDRYVHRFDYGNLTGRFPVLQDRRKQLFFEAYDGAGWLPIPDERSFRRLLIAVLNIGLPLPRKAQGDSVQPPPVLRFFARPSKGKERAEDATAEGGDASGASSGGDDDSGRADSTAFGDIAAASLGSGGQSTPRPTRQRQSKETKGFGASEESILVSTSPRASRRPSRKPLAGSATGADKTVIEIIDEEPTVEDRARANVANALVDVANQHSEAVHNLYAKIAGRDQHHRDPGDPNHDYRPPYSKISLHTYQTYPTGWLLHNGDRIFHYLADQPGLGKTFESAEMMIRLMLVLSNNVAIEEERARLVANTATTAPVHMHPASASGGRWPRNTACQANILLTYGFVCQCDPKSLLHSLLQQRRFSPGYMLILCAPVLIPQWQNELNRFLQQNVRLPHNRQPIEIVAMRDMPSRTRAFQEFIFGRRAHCGLGAICIAAPTATVKAAVSELSSTGHWGGPLPRRIPTQQPSLIFWDEMHATRTSDTLPYQLIDRLLRHAASPVHVIGLSGTPITFGPEDFGPVRSIAEHTRLASWHGQACHTEVKQRLAASMDAMTTAARAVTRSDNIAMLRQQKSISASERGEADRLLTQYDLARFAWSRHLPLLQRQGGSDYLGYQIAVPCPDFEIEIQACDSVMTETQKKVANGYRAFLQVQYRRRVLAWSRRPEDSRGPRPKLREVLFELGHGDDRAFQSREYVDTSLIGFLPGLADRILKRDPHTKEFRSDEIIEMLNKGAGRPQRHIFTRHRLAKLLPEAFRTPEGDLPKLQVLRTILDTMMADRSPHTRPRGKQHTILPKKALIYVPHPWHGFALTTYLFEAYPDHNFSYIHASMKAGLKRQLLAPFQRRTDREDDLDSDPDDPIALIGGLSVIGRGLNLTRCNYAIALSPPASPADMEQFFARINRKGQACAVHCYCLYDSGNPVDVTCYQRLRNRTALSLPAGAGMAGIDFLLDGEKELEAEELGAMKASVAAEAEPADESDSDLRPPLKDSIPRAIAPPDVVSISSDSGDE